MAPTPKFGKTPLELLEPNTDYEPTFFEKHKALIFGPPTGLGLSMATNLGLRRPLIFSGMFSVQWSITIESDKWFQFIIWFNVGFPRHIAFSVASYFCFRFYVQYNEDYNAERDAVYRHYIQLHPEDFPPPGKLISLCLLEWVCNLCAMLFSLMILFCNFRTETIQRSVLDLDSNSIDCGRIDFCWIKISL